MRARLQYCGYALLYWQSKLGCIARGGYKFPSIYFRHKKAYFMIDMRTATAKEIALYFSHETNGILF